MDSILFAQLPSLFESVGALFNEKKEELCAMDAKLGDGDLGLTMRKGFGSLPDILRAETEAADGDAGKLLMKAGMKMASVVPSTMGFLMSSGIMEGGKALRGKGEIQGMEMAMYLQGFAAGVEKRGKCKLGQRKLFDAIAPAADAARRCAEGTDARLLEVLRAALDAAAQGVEATRTMVPVFGKAAVHAAQCAGVADQGALAGFYMIQGMCRYVCD